MLMHMAGELEAILNEMKGKGIGGAIVRVDGVPVASTIALTDVSASLLSSVANVSDAIMKKMNDQQREVEVSFGDGPADPGAKKKTKKKAAPKPAPPGGAEDRSRVLKASYHHDAPGGKN